MNSSSDTCKMEIRGLILNFLPNETLDHGRMQEDMELAKCTDLEIKMFDLEINLFFFHLR